MAIGITILLLFTEVQLIEAFAQFRITRHLFTEIISFEVTCR
jgi:hypothetical protein